MTRDEPRTHIAMILDRAAGTYSDDLSCWHDHADALLSAIPGLSGLLAGTHVVVPREPTPDMAIAGGIAWCERWVQLTETDHTAVDPACACYRAMIAQEASDDRK